MVVVIVMGVIMVQVVSLRSELRRARRIRRRGKVNIVLKAKERKVLPRSGAETNVTEVFLADKPLLRNLLSLFCFQQYSFEEPQAEEIHPRKVRRHINIDLEIY